MNRRRRGGGPGPRGGWPRARARGRGRPAFPQNAFNFTYPDQNTQNTRQGFTRRQYHDAWNAAAADEIHWDLGRGGFDGTPLDITWHTYGAPASDRPGEEQNDGKFLTWQSTGGPPVYAQSFGPNVGQNNFFLPTNYRIQELVSLHLKGQTMLDHGAIPPMGYAANCFIEPRWEFCGIVDETTQNFHELSHLPDAWSIFKYVLSDLRHNGIQIGTDIMQTLSDIVCDIINIAYPIVTENSVCMLYFQGEYSDNDGHHWGNGNKPWIFFTNKGYRVGDIIVNPTEVLTAISNGLQAHLASNHFISFQFYRVYFAIMTGFGAAGGGGSLAGMPFEMKQLRESKFYSGRKGYICVEDDKEMCGFLALLHGLANVVARIKKTYKVLSTQSPEICKKLLNYHSKITNQTKGGKGIQAEFLLEMIKVIGWTEGTTVSPEELCQITRHFRTLYNIDIGLIIFDAVYPLKSIITSYDASESKLPTEKICLVYWKYEEGGGHYDCIYSTNLSSWLLRGTENRKNLIFCFRTLKMVRNNETTEKGELCLNCGFYEKEIKLKGGEFARHGSVNSITYYECKNCNVRFNSQECFDLHSQKPHGLSTAACESRRKCVTCHKVHGNEFDCKFFFCRVCMKKIPICERQSHTCYIQWTSKKKKKKIENVVYADCEGSRLKGYHTAVCLAASWYEMCPEHKKLSTKIKCEICRDGDQEFGPFCTDCGNENGYLGCDDCQRRHSKFFLDNCVNEFLEWLEATFKKVTVVFHNGGRYDMHLIYTELLSSGKFYIKREAERGTQIIFMVASLLAEEKRKRSVEIKFIDSFNFITSSLRNFPKMFNIDEKLLSKGHFPYDLLNGVNWKAYKGVCPDFDLFGISLKELENIDRLGENRRRHIEEILAYIEAERKEGKPWVALDKLEEYTMQDVYVLQAGCEDFRYNYWKICKTDPFHWVTLAAAVAGSYRQSQYMPQDSIQVFKMEQREWQRRGLRGGRCEPFKLYWKAASDTEEIKIYDVNSEYPAAQMTAYMPEGKMTFEKIYKDKNFDDFLEEIKKEYKINFIDALFDPTGAHGNGILECEIEGAYCMYPILPYKDDNLNKNLFKIINGWWCGYICVLAEAIQHSQVVIKKVRRIEFWQKTTNKLFKDFLGPIYASKVHATGWKKTLGGEVTDEEKEAYIETSRKMGVPIEEEEMKENAGKRSTAKVMANCGWGYLCQKPHAKDILYFQNSSENEMEEMKDILLNLESTSDPRRMTNHPQKIGNYTRLKLTKAPDQIVDSEMNHNIAYHVGGIAPAWGLQLLSRTILQLHESQPVYCDTDSVFFVYDSENKEHNLIGTGPYLGDFVDEYPEYRIVEYVCTGPKSYYFKMLHRQSGKIVYKGKFKGLPTTSTTYSLMNDDNEVAAFGMEQMKQILYSAYVPPGYEDEEEVDKICFKFHYTNFFKRNQDLKIKETLESKTIQFTFNKRQVLWPDEKAMENWHEVNTLPFADEEAPLTIKDVQDFWLKYT